MMFIQLDFYTKYVAKIKVLIIVIKLTQVLYIYKKERDGILNGCREIQFFSNISKNQLFIEYTGFCHGSIFELVQGQEYQRI